MSAESKKVYAAIDKYVQCMKGLGKTPSSITVTKKQFDALKDAHKKSQAKGILKDVPFSAEYDGIEIEVNYDY